MKKLARLVGIVGGVAAVLWAMRDRLISIAAPREPEPPKFRVVTSPPMKAEDDLTEVVGIGPVFAARLSAAGITSFRAMVGAGVDRVAEAAEVPVSRAQGWISQASALST